MKSITIFTVLVALILIPVLAIASETDANESSNENGIFLNFSSKPIGAKISISYLITDINPSFTSFDNIGLTPIISVPMGEGVYRLKGKLKGYKDIKVDLILKEDTKKEVVFDFAGYEKEGWFNWRSFLLGHTVGVGIGLVGVGLFVLAIAAAFSNIGS